MPPVSSFTPEQRIAAKPADTTRSSLTTLTADPDLALPIGASATEIWFFEFLLLQFGANTAMNSKYGFSVPSGATGSWGAHDNGTQLGGWNPLVPGAAPGASLALSASLSLATASNGITLLNFAGWVYGGGTAGNLGLLWAQNTSDAGNLTLKAGSFLRMTKLRP